MLEGVERLHKEVNRLRRHRGLTIRPAPGLPPVEVRPGDELEISYEGEARRIRVLAITSWGLRAWDEAKKGMRGFRFDKIGREPPHETDGAAQA